MSMRRLMLIAALSLFANSAQAAWQFIDVSDDESIAFKAGALDVTGVVEMQYYCDDGFPGAIDLTIYTGETHEPDSSYATEGIMGVSVDGELEVEVTAFFDNFEGELLIYTSNFDVENMGDVMEAMFYAEDSIGISYYGRDYLFSAENVWTVLGQMADDCPE
jgi:hypothetical protein